MKRFYKVFKDAAILVIFVLFFISLYNFLTKNVKKTGKVLLPKKEVKKRIKKKEVFLKFDLNKASYSDLKKIKGIGDKLARNILSYREKYGRFYSVRELKKVKGIGEKKYEKIAPHFFVNF